MFHVILHQPEIPPNTGNIIRLCANTGATLHLIEPLGFGLDDRRLRRAGLDYHEYARVCVHAGLPVCRRTLSSNRLFVFSTRGERCYADVRYKPGDALMFGSETSGLPQAVLDDMPPERRLRVPMRPDSRSLNLSNTVAVVLFEAWRQNDFRGAAC
jgi:tRNA (cytidine/uridine-2'-O-)-methyltransferase